MAYRVEFTDLALGDLEDVASFLSPAGEDIVKENIRRLFESALNLGEHPLLGRVTPEYKNPNIRDFVKGPYRIVYLVKEPERVIQVIRFWHGARGYLPKF